MSEMYFSKNETFLETKTNTLDTNMNISSFCIKCTNKIREIERQL